MTPRRVLPLCCFCFAALLAYGQEKPAATNEFNCRITGLFSPDREQDLRDVLRTMPQFQLVGVDYATADATIAFDPSQTFRGEKPEKCVERFDHELRSASQHTFGARPPRTIPLDRLSPIEIPVVGLDCKACSLAAYELVYKLPGVEIATASFELGKVAALIDPQQISRADLEAALKKGGVQLARP